jgi:hypothetical protein
VQQKSVSVKDLKARLKSLGTKETAKKENTEVKEGKKKTMRIAWSFFLFFIATVRSINN